MRLGTALAFISALMFLLQLECTPTCQMRNGNGDYVEGHCPVTLTPAVSQKPGEMYSECVTICVWMKADDFYKTPKIKILSPYKQTIRPTVKRSKHKHKCFSGRISGGIRVCCDEREVIQKIQRSNASFILWELCDCVKVYAERVVSVSFSTTSASCSVSYTVPDPVPQFALSVNRSVKSVTVTVEQGEKVHTRWCYLRGECIVERPSPQITIDPSQSRSAVLHIPYLLPCVCVQVYYTHTDARREKQCPFQKTLTDVEDVWRSSEVIMYESVLKWSSECPVSSMNISALLCWKQHEHLCIPVLNSTLDGHENGPTLIYNTSAVDKHPQMCVQFSLQGSHNITCPFQADMSSWEVNIGSGRQSVSVKLTSLAPAKFSIQFCIFNQMRCSPTGPVHTLRMEGETTETKIKVPPHILVQAPCVQVWQSHPALNGKRILCPDYAHKRFGLYVTAALTLVIIFALFGYFLHRLTRSGAAGWLWIQKEVLLVCSSEQSAHVSAVCALASVLQGELKATVHMALWAQSSQPGARTGVADVGPLPWLYGQWESMHKAQGKVLIIWSPEAKTTYEKWKAREKVDKSEIKKEKGSDVEEDYKLNGIRLGKCKKKKERAALKEDCVKLCHDKDFSTQRESCSVIAPVFAGALACLQGSLQQCRGQGVAIVYFQGFGHSRDIPKALRELPRYCLPQDFRGLIQELGGMRRGTKSKGHCWPRLMSKVQSIWLARQLARRLQTLLPQMQGQKTQSFTPSQKKTTEKTEPSLAADEASPETVQEQEPLRGSPWTAERP